MASNMPLMVLMPLLILLASSAHASHATPQNQDLVVAISEMQRANYFTFITLLNMISPFDQRFRGNLTFLMPNDRMLSKITMLQDDVAEFLLRHSIPSPMLFDYLLHIPTGSIIPSSKPDYVLKISSNGRKNFFLNNVKLISPNICTAGSVVRCHGVDGVLSAENPVTTVNSSTNSPSASCFSTPTPTSPAPFLSPSPLPPVTGLSTPALSQNAGSSMFPGGVSTFSITIVMVSLWISSLHNIL